MIDYIAAVLNTTLNMWSSDVGFDTLVADPVELHKRGVGESMQNVPAEPAEFLALLTTSENLRGTRRK